MKLKLTEWNNLINYYSKDLSSKHRSRGNGTIVKEQLEN